MENGYTAPQTTTPQGGISARFKNMMRTGGRANRKEFAIITAGLFGLWLIVTAIVFFFFAFGPLGFFVKNDAVDVAMCCSFEIIISIVAFCLLTPSMMQRLHDINRSGWLAFLVVIPPAITLISSCIGLILSGLSGNIPVWSPQWWFLLIMCCSMIVCILSLYFLCLLLFKAGTPERNKYGEPPR